MVKEPDVIRLPLKTFMRRLSASWCSASWRPESVSTIGALREVWRERPDASVSWSVTGKVSLPMVTVPVRAVASSLTV